MGIRRTVFSIGLLALYLTARPRVEAQVTRDDWGRAEAAIVRLSPSAFADLPPQLRTALEHRGCTIPQPYDAGGQKKNVITGGFTSAAQTDWAVLCSREKRSAILVFRGGRSDHVDSLAEEPDSQYLQVVAGGREIGYSRLLAVAKPKVVRRRFTHRTLPAVDHDGIENTFLGKASVVWYRSGGKWMQVSGAD